MRYVLLAKEALKKKALLFPYGPFFRGEKEREFTPEMGALMVANFKGNVPTNELPINVEHQDFRGRIGVIEDVWLGDDGVYARFELNAIGTKLIKEDRFKYLSPEVAWTFEHPQTGKKHYCVLVGGAVTNYPFHMGRTVMFSRAAQQSWSIPSRRDVHVDEPLDEEDDEDYANEDEDEEEEDYTSSPKNKFGLTAEETLQFVDENGKFNKRKAGYTALSPFPDKVCGTCRFFLRKAGSETGRCEAIKGRISWRGFSALYIDAAEESVSTLANAPIPIQKDVRTFMFFVGTGTKDNEQRRTSSLMILVGRQGILFDAGKDISVKNLPTTPEVIFVTDEQFVDASKELGSILGIDVLTEEWSNNKFQVNPINGGYRIDVSDVTVTYTPTSTDVPDSVDVAILDGSNFEAAQQAVKQAHDQNVGRVIFTNVAPETEKRLILLLSSGVEVPQDGQAIILRAALLPGRQNFRPLKTGGGYGENEFADPRVSWEVWGKSNTPFAVEKKYDGWRVIAHKKGEEVALVTEDTAMALGDLVSTVVESVQELKGNLILDGELEIFAARSMSVNENSYQQGEKIERRDMVSFLNADESAGPFTAVYSVFDVLYRDGDLHRLPWKERRSILEELMRETDSLKIVQTAVVRTEKNFLRELKLAANLDNSEGAMLKHIDAAYALSGETLEWAKVKRFKEVRGTVKKVRKVPNAGFIYTLALADGEIIGNTETTRVKADVGDVLEARVGELSAEKEGEKIIPHWENAIVHSKKPKDTALTTIQQVVQMADSEGFSNIVLKFAARKDQEIVLRIG